MQIIELDPTKITVDQNKRLPVSVAVTKEGRHWQTIISNLEPIQIGKATPQDVIKFFKKECNTGGHIQAPEGAYVIQGNVADKICVYLKSCGVTDVIRSGAR